MKNRLTIFAGYDGSAIIYFETNESNAKEAWESFNSICEETMINVINLMPIELVLEDGEFNVLDHVIFR